MSKKGNNMRPTVCGWGIHGGNDGSTKTFAYMAWASMIRRCYSKKPNGKSYRECSVDERFRIFSDFSEWAKSQIGHGEPGFHLDKDLIQKGNKVYSPDLCVFLPADINNLLQLQKGRRGNLPIGVTAKREQPGFFYASMSVANKKFNIARCTTPNDAFEAYKAHKESRIKMLAELWKEKIDPRAFDALMRYEVQITD